METAKTFQLKGSIFTLTVLRLQSVDFDTLTTELDATTKQAPKFFENAPIVIDLQPLSQLGLEVDFAKLVTILKEQHLIPIGVRNGNPEQHEQAAKAHLAILPNIKSTDAAEAGATTEKTSKTSEQTTTTTDTPNRKDTPTRVITEPVRSGKQIYAKGGDLLILAPVSHGAEVIADGNIHIYGPLRGRAMAGVQGDATARIFCSELDAELVSIAGHYKVSEELNKSKTTDEALTHIFLNKGELQITGV